MLLIIWLKKVEVRVCSLLDSQNKLSLTTSLPHKLCSLQDDLQATLSQTSVCKTGILPEDCVQAMTAHLVHALSLW